MNSETPTAVAIPAAFALVTAEADALLAYDDLGPYRVDVRLEGDGWHVEYRIKHRYMAGGGPWYVIDAATGAIVSKNITSNRPPDAQNP